VNTQAQQSEVVALPRENVFGHTKKVMLFRAAFAELRDQREGITILDVGCGSGYAVTQHLGEPSDDVLGIDLYEPNIAYATSNYSRKGLRFECRSAETLNATRQQFQAVVLADVLEHLDDPLLVLKECSRLLEPNGILLITVPNGFGPFEFESAIARCPFIGAVLVKITDWVIAALNKFGPLRGKWTEALAETPADLPYNAESGHVQFFTQRRLAALLGAAGFKIVARENLSLFSGPFSNYMFAAFSRFCRWNVHVADFVPASLASGWLLKCTANT